MLLHSAEFATNQPHHVVTIDVRGFPGSQINLLENWFSMWCMRYCKGSWSVATQNQRHLSVSFDEASEAIYFKLSANSNMVFVESPLEYLH